MARTERGSTLTAQHKQAQLRIRARVLRDFIRLWPIWEGDDKSFGRLVTAAVPLVQINHSLSAALAVSYYEALRKAEAAAGRSTPKIAPALDPVMLAVSLHVTGRVTARKAIGAGHSRDEAMKTALVGTSGAVTRHVLAGGRDTLIASTEADPAARGWRRVTAPRACSYCRKQAAKGTSNDNFHAHDHCGCSAEPVFH